MAVEHDDLLPTAVFSGQYAEAIFVQSLLEAEGINGSLNTSFTGIGFHASPAATVYVSRRDAARAHVIVQDFKRRSTISAVSSTQDPE